MNRNSILIYDEKETLSSLYGDVVEYFNDNDFVVTKIDNCLKLAKELATNNVCCMLIFSEANDLSFELIDVLKQSENGQFICSCVFSVKEVSKENILELFNKGCSEYYHLQIDDNEIFLARVKRCIENSKKLFCYKEYENELKKQASNKSEYLSKMSHEMRTPLNTIIGMSDILLRKSMDNDTKDLVKNINRSSSFLLNIINDVLDLSKIEAGEFSLLKQETRLSNIIEHLESITKFLTAQKKLASNLEVNGDIPATIMADANRLRQVLVNLLTNAIKFTSSGHISLIINIHNSEEKKVLI